VGREDFNAFAPNVTHAPPWRATVLQTCGSFPRPSEALRAALMLSPWSGGVQRLRPSSASESLLRRVRDFLGFTARARSRRSGGHYLQRTRGTHERKGFSGTEPALAALAESWEKLARARDHPRLPRLVHIERQKRRGAWVALQAFVIMIGCRCDVMVRGGRGSTAVNASGGGHAPYEAPSFNGDRVERTPRVEQVATVIHRNFSSRIVSAAFAKVQISDPLMASRRPVTRNQATKRRKPPRVTRRTSAHRGLRPRRPVTLEA
jgi:hypothetical protein